MRRLCFAGLCTIIAMLLLGQQQAVAIDLIEWSDGTYDISVAPAVVTSDVSGSHTTTPGTAFNGVNHDGVGDLLIEATGDSVFDFRCTASLLELGGHQWAISAAHCVTDGVGAKNANNLQLTFETTSGNKVSTVSAPAQIFVHPSWNGNIINGHDVALLQFDSVADPAVPGYLLNRTANEQNVTMVNVGYGNEGLGSTGQQSGTSGTKRAGLNKWESQGLNIGGITNNSTMLTSDFDSGILANDAFNFFFGDTPDLGFGNDEVGVSQGDSGGPSFLQDPGDNIWKIAGTHSHGLRLAKKGSGKSSDVDSSLNFSWGEFSVDARVRDQAIIDWIDVTVPEPGSMVLLGSGLSLLALWGGKRRRSPNDTVWRVFF